jgi:hypothetical protein
VGVFIPWTQWIYVFSQQAFLVFARTWFILFSVLLFVWQVNYEFIYNDCCVHYCFCHVFSPLIRSKLNQHLVSLDLFLKSRRDPYTLKRGVHLPKWRRGANSLSSRCACKPSTHSTIATTATAAAATTAPVTSVHIYQNALRFKGEVITASHTKTLTAHIIIAN